MARKDAFDLGQAGSITALLGPTNTGKTYLAVQRMLGHRSGMIGLPLRLLAREVYERVVQAKGLDQVALVTGEQKIVPPGARFWICTVESMPVDRPVAFLAVDEIQLATDPARGHTFTARLLHARGVRETWFLGSDTMTSMVQRLVPTAVIRSQPRLSRLSYAGSRKLVGLAPRSAVVAFSVRQVYALADRLRAKHGGAAVVLGALSPRTRNAQVELFQSGAVQHMVATDAVGMGLNMDVHHVARAGAAKFDGRSFRNLRADELAQIAGRAGRWRRDGTFGETAGLEPLDPDVVHAIELHQFAPVQRVMWRSNDLDMSSGDALMASLNRPPPMRCLVPVRDANDALVLAAMLSLEEVRVRLTCSARVRLLWQVCGVPDFGHVLPEHHAGLLSTLFCLLVDGDGVVPDAWMAKQVHRLDRDDGDLGTLMARIAAVRTWTFVANAVTWLDDAKGWQATTRGLEDRISDALHAKLTARFVDRRSAWVAAARLDDDSEPPTLARDGTVRVGDDVLGRVRGLTFHLEPGAKLSAPVLRAVRSLVSPLVNGRVQSLLASPDGAFAVDGQGWVHWDRQPVARLERGATWWQPRVRMLRHDGVEGADRGKVAARLEAWLPGWLAYRRDAVGEVSGVGHAALGLVHAVASSGGAVPVAEVRDLVARLSAEDAAVLRARGVVLGRWWVFHPRSVEHVRDRAALWRVWRGDVPELPDDGGVVPFRGRWPAATARALGFHVAGPWLVRADTLEAVDVGGAAEAQARGIPPEVTAALSRLLHRPGSRAPRGKSRIRGRGVRTTETS